ncbi:MAG: ribulose phosphate epimerase [Sulfobacillus benefaciens]|uniref:Ribulose phosphate epimerase n=1 Tax=Sulfobacillus benefaciens TaxID=453960 RepID=A0A2T2XF24_9FIRM|nr:MAG: ribulose phosphate epimerase [Sulfobacillus benefaciens]
MTTYAWSPSPTWDTQRGQEFIQQMDSAWLEEDFHSGSVTEARLVIQAVDAQSRPFRRQNHAVYVLGVLFLDEINDDKPLLVQFYPYLIRSLSNLLVVVVGDPKSPSLYVATLERGVYPIVASSRYRELTRRIAPLARSHLIVKNRFDPDLPSSLWKGTHASDSLREGGRALDSWDLLPTPFPMQELLSADDYRHVQRMFNIGGLSYGNLSARHDEETFWMSASGVNKGRLNEIGRDILLVKDYDEDEEGMVLSVPEHVSPRRVSVDAIEHWKIYRAHPEVGAIIHVHAWMADVPSTDINYPCGTIELASAVSEHIDQAEDPSQAVVGLRNHGLTITGRSVEDILNRIDGHIIREVPMS